MEEQERIVTRIEELFSKLDNGVETLRKTKQQLAVYRQAVLKEAFDKAGEKQVPLRGIIEKPRYGTSKKCSYDVDEHSLPVYRIPNINYFQGTISHDDLKYASFTEDEFDSLKLRSGDSAGFLVLQDGMIHKNQLKKLEKLRMDMGVQIWYTGYVGVQMGTAFGGSHFL